MTDAIIIILKLIYIAKGDINTPAGYPAGVYKASRVRHN